MKFPVELDFDPLSFRKLLHVNARKFERISSQEYYHKTSFSENKTYKLKRSITQQFAWIYSDSFLLFYFESKY